MVISMDRWKGKIAIVTGASAGIGAEIAVQLANAGVKVVGLARRVEQVEELAKTVKPGTGNIHALKADVKNEQDILEAFQWTKSNLGPIHILINNAGINSDTNLVEGNTQKWKDIFDVNVLGLCIATREAIQDMKANKVDGHIIHINSMSGHRIAPVPNLNVYPASKHAVKALTETLRQELNSMGSKIKITSVSPGAVQTEIFQTASKEAQAAYKNVPMLKAEDIADGVMYVLGTPPHVQIHEMMIRPIGAQF